MALFVNNLNPSAIPASSIQPTGAMSPWGFLGLSKRVAEVEKIGDGSCYQYIVAKYPSMDSASQTMVKMICENELNSHVFWEGVINGAVGGTILTALVALGIYAARTCARSGESQPLLSANNIQA